MTEKKKGKLILTSCECVACHNKNKKLQIAFLVADNKLEYIKVLPSADAFLVGTILTGKVKNVVPSIPAAFVALDKENTMGFLPLLKTEQAVLTNRSWNGRLQSGDEVVVQVVREAMKTKETSLTTEFALSSRYAAIRLGSGRLLFSKKLSVREKEAITAYLEAKAICTKDKKLIGMPDVDITIRTEVSSLLKKEALSYLVQDIGEAYAGLRQMISQAKMRTCYSVHQTPVTWMDELYQEISLCGFEIEEYVTDDLEMLKTLKGLLEQKFWNRIRLYQDTMLSLSVLYGLQTKLEELTQTKVWLPGGGYLCIEPTEALIVIDVNTGKAIQKGDPEQGFFDVNKEAAYEIARQLRLRNLSGMVLIDFINMKDKTKEEELLSCMKTYVKNDFSSVKVYEFTRLGLLELVRNKKSRALHEIIRGS